MSSRFSSKCFEIVLMRCIFEGTVHFHFLFRKKDRIACFDSISFHSISLQMHNENDILFWKWKHDIIYENSFCLHYTMIYLVYMASEDADYFLGDYMNRFMVTINSKYVLMLFVPIFHLWVFEFLEYLSSVVIRELFPCDGSYIWIVLSSMYFDWLAVLPSIYYIFDLRLLAF